EGKTLEITIEQAKTLLKSFNLTRRVKVKGKEPVEVADVVGLRDRAIIATLAYTACRAGAVAKPRLGDFQHDGTQYVLQFQEKGGKSREIPVRRDLEGFILAYIAAAGIADDAKDSPLFRAGNGRSSKLAAGPLGTERICERVKRRLKDAGLSPHSFRVTAITSLLEQGVTPPTTAMAGGGRHRMSRPTAQVLRRLSARRLEDLCGAIDYHRSLFHSIRRVYLAGVRRVDRPVETIDHPNAHLVRRS